MWSASGLVQRSTTCSASLWGFAFGIDRYQTIVAVPVKKRDFLGSLQNFERQTTGIVPRDPANDAQALRIDGRCKVMVQRRLAGGRQWQLQSWKILGDIPNGYRVTRTFPISTQVGMPVCCSRSRLWFGRLNIYRSQAAVPLPEGRHRGQGEHREDCRRCRQPEKMLFSH